MKKCFAILMLLCLCCASASAAEWSEIEPELAEAGLTGRFVNLYGPEKMIWIPDGFNARELDEAQLDDGYIACFTTDDEMRSIEVQRVVLIEETIKDVRSELNKQGMKGFADANVNGMKGFFCRNEEFGARILVLDLAPTEILLLTCIPIEDAAWRFVGASIQDIQYNTEETP